MVLAILGAALALAVPAFDRLAPGFALRAAARDTAAMLREARGLAVARNREVAVAVDVQSHRIGIEGSGRMTPIDEAFGISLYSAAEEMLDAGTGRIRFYPDGTSTGGRIGLSLGGIRYDIRVSWITGAVTLHD